MRPVVSTEFPATGRNGGHSPAVSTGQKQLLAAVFAVGGSAGSSHPLPAQECQLGEVVWVTQFQGGMLAPRDNAYKSGKVC